MSRLASVMVVADLAVAIVGVGSVVAAFVAVDLAVVSMVADALAAAVDTSAGAAGTGAGAATAVVAATDQSVSSGWLGMAPPSHATCRQAPKHNGDFPMRPDQVPKAGVLVAAGALLCASLLRPVPADAARPVAPEQSTQTEPALQDAMPRDVGARLQRLHDQLGITPVQEVLWKPVVAAMQESAHLTDAARQARRGRAQPMTALDDIQTYEAIAAAHASGLKMLAAAFTPLYAAMPPPQQKAVDMVFGQRMRPGRQGQARQP